jgi:hypothetical protein
MPAKGISIHIGLNYVDPAAYNGWDGALDGCINDANDMKAIAEGLGYAATIMTDSDATSDDVIAAIGNAAVDLAAGDILFISYSGHGNQVPDVAGDEDDGKDETWCLWDRQLLDDELYALWAKFQPGVRIIMLSDSCHSGTMARMVAAYAELKRPRNGPDRQAGLRQALAALIPVRVPEARPGIKAGPPRPPEPSRVKLMPSDVRAVVNNQQAKQLAARQFVAGPSERAAIGASVILISGCQDHEVSLDGSANGLFTEKLKSVWNDGSFTGSYQEFATSIRGVMPPNQQPNYYVVGAPNADFEAQIPFAIEGSKGAGAGASTGTTTGTSSGSPVSGGSTKRPTLKEGDEGAAVQLLKEYLLNWNFNIEVDAKFDAKTKRFVESFQAQHALESTGVVDQATWDALD